MQPLATDVRVMTRLYVDGTEENELGDVIAHYRTGSRVRLYFFPAPQTFSQAEGGVSVTESRLTVKAPYSRMFRPGDRLADADGTPRYEVVSVTDYPGHQTMEVQPI